MGKHSKRYFVFVFLGIFILLVSIYGYYLLTQRRDVPEGIAPESILKIDGAVLQRAADLEFILCQKKIGQLCIFEIQTPTGIVLKSEQITAYYARSPYPIIYLIIGLFCFIIALFVFWIKPEDEKAEFFFWAFVFLSCILILVGPFYILSGSWLSYVPGLVYLICYPLAPAMLFRFSLSFSDWKPRWYVYLVFGAAALFIGSNISTYLYSLLAHSLQVFHIYLFVGNIFRAYVVIIVITSIALFVRSFKKAVYDEQRARIKWIIFGLIIGLGPLIFLYQLPRALGFSPVLSEEISTAFAFFLPICLGIAIVKYKLMNIDLITNRSLVYSILTGFIVGIYMLLVWILSETISGFFAHQQAIFSLAGALGAALVFHPARRRIQEFVDRSFFRTSYDYRQSILHFNEKAPEFIHQSQLVDYFLQAINVAMPQKICGVIIASRQKNGQIELYTYSGNKFNQYDLLSELPQHRILARLDSMRTKEGIDFSYDTVLSELGIELVIPLLFRNQALSGYVCLGKKRSEDRYAHNDLELLRSLTAELTAIWERIYLQGLVVKERAEKEKLDELIREKSEFIATVSHELRTPMSSIHGLSELLLDGKIKEGEKKNEMLALMNRECTRLSRLLHNILDFGQIESKTKKYHFSDIDLSVIIEETCSILANRLQSDNFLLKLDLPEIPVVVKVDIDSIKQALLNLIDNAIKYSSDKRVIRLRLLNHNESVEIHVIDQGIGIAEAEQENIFLGFYRARSGEEINPSGIGLGLKIVKHIMEAHGGFIRIDSRLNQGSNFQMVFPRK